MHAVDNALPSIQSIVTEEPRKVGAVIERRRSVNACAFRNDQTNLTFGAPPPAATWGGLLADSRQFIVTAPWLGIFPGVTLSICVLAINFIGDGLRERFDPGLQT